MCIHDAWVDYCRNMFVLQMATSAQLAPLRQQPLIKMYCKNVWEEFMVRLVTTELWVCGSGYGFDILHGCVMGRSESRNITKVLFGILLFWMNLRSIHMVRRVGVCNAWWWLAGDYELLSSAQSLWQRHQVCQIHIIIAVQHSAECNKCIWQISGADVNRYRICIFVYGSMRDSLP
jgi:hypothetical protein